MACTITLTTDIPPGLTTQARHQAVTWSAIRPAASTPSSPAGSTPQRSFGNGSRVQVCT
jgi:hypothetical protein